MTMDASTRRSLTIIAAVAIVLALIAGVVLSTRDDDDAAAEVSTEQTDDPRESEEELGLARRDADDITAIGDVDAPLVLIEYSDYRCPFCGVFARDTMPVLMEEYIETGKVRFEWRDLPVFGEESMDGAMAARAAGEQGLYWEYHDAMYADAPERGHLAIDREKIMAWAREVGVPDLAKFEADLENADLRAAVEADAAEGQSIGANGTPTFLVGKTPMVGAQPVDAFRDLIDEQLEAMGEN